VIDQIVLPLTWRCLWQPEEREEGKAPPPDRRRFILHVEAGAFTDSEIVVMLGEVSARAKRGGGGRCVLVKV
jgi:hypothetical protein